MYLLAPEIEAFNASETMPTERPDIERRELRGNPIAT